MKKRKLLVGCLSMMVLLGGVVGCNDNKNPDDVEKPTVDKYSITLRSKENLTLEVGKASNVTVDLKKNDVKDDSLELDYEISDSTIIGFDVNAKRISSLKKGSANLTLWIKDHKDAGTVKINVTAVEYFFNRDIIRGNPDLTNEDKGSVELLSGEQSTLLAKEQSTHFIFKTHFTIPSDLTIGSYHSFGVGSFVDNGDTALWFGVRKMNGHQNGEYQIYIRNFYNGWSNATTDETPEGYQVCTIGNEIDLEIVRNGAEYAYTINEFHGKYTDTNPSYALPTYPGLYSQEIPITISNWSVDYTEANVVSAYEGYNAKPVVSIKINEKEKNRLLRGFTYNYTAIAYPTYSINNDSKVVFEIDKSKMTAGQNGTSVTESGALTLGNDAAGVVKLIAKSTAGDAKDELDITVLDVADEKENDLLSVSGGVDLTSDGTVIFPKEMMGLDGVGNEQNYQDTVYSAVLKNQYSHNFSFEMEVSNYESNVDNPKLQVALGNNKNNFYVVYKNDGTYRIEVFAKALFPNGTYGDGWFNSSLIGGSNFDKNAKHKFKVTVDTNGKYNVYFDDNLLTFTNNDQEVTLMRDFETYSSDQNIKIATKGVSAEVSNIKVTDGSDTTIPEYWKYTDNVIANDNGDINFKLTNHSWNTRDRYANRIIKTASLDNSFAIDYDVEFSETNDDSKIVMILGNTEVQVCNKLTNEHVMKGLLFKDNNWGEDKVITNANEADKLKAHIRLENNNGELRLVINDILVGTKSVSNINHIEFYAFNGNDTDKDKTVTISNLEVSDYNVYNLYDFSIEGGTKRTLMATQSETLNLIGKINGVKSEVTGITYQISDESIISFDENTKTVKGLEVGIATLTITWVEGKQQITLNYEISDRPVENELLKVKGGALLDADGTVTFPESMINTNGVGDEQNYSEGTYGADFKNTVKGDFSIEFTVSDYKVADGVEYPKLMVSLGGSREQFYVAYKPNGEYRVESFTTKVDGNWLETNHGDWVNTDNFSDFDINQAHTYKISVEHGQYHVYVDGHECEMNLGGTRVRSARRYDDYNSETPIRISTNGVSAKVSNISVVNNPETDSKYYYLSNVSNVTNTGFTLRADNNAWNNRDKFISRINLLQNINTNPTIEFDLDFTSEMTDSKLMVAIGNMTVMINNKMKPENVISCNIQGVEGYGDWDAQSMTTSSISNLHVKIEVVDGSSIKVSINDEVLRNYTNSNIASGSVYFVFFNGEGSEADVLANVTNLTIN